MPPKPAKDQKAYLHDMLESAQKAVSYVQGISYEEFWHNSEKRDAVAMRIAAIGEAARQVTPATEEAVPNVPFHLIRGMRKVTQHDLNPLASELGRYLTEEKHRLALAQKFEPPRLLPPSP